MPNKHHLSFLHYCLSQGEEGIHEWNNWRKKNPEVMPDLSDADLQSLKLCFVNQSNDTNHYTVTAIDLSNANLLNANFSYANLSHVNLTNAFLVSANLSHADVSGVIYNRKKMQGYYQGIRGLGSCYGDAIFKRDATEQDYLDTLEYRWQQKQGIKRWYYLTCFAIWRNIDFGRRIRSVVYITCYCILTFAIIYSFYPNLISISGHKSTPFSMFYFSIITFTTLGLGQIKGNNLSGELIISLQVFLGYINLGLLISVLANKITRKG